VKVVFYASDKPREHVLAGALKSGCEAAGDEFELRRTDDYGESDRGDYYLYPGPTPDTDVAVFFGVKGKSRVIMEEHLAMGRATILLDKGITRERGPGGGHTLYTKCFVNGPDPSPYFMRKRRAPDRFNALGIPLAKRRRGTNILFCGSSHKYHEFHRLTDPTTYAARIVEQLRGLTNRPIIYRPKPSWKDAKPIAHSLFSSGSQSLTDALRAAYCVVTHGSGAAFYAICAGVPVISLGPSIALPVAERSLENIDDLYWPEQEERQAWANAVAWTQFTTEELADGFAWRHLRGIISKTVKGQEEEPNEGEGTH